MTFAEVKLWGTRIGVVSVDDSEKVCFFEYDKDFIKSGIEVSPFMMPLSTNIYSFPNLNYETFKGLPGLLADSLPDKYGNAVIDAWLYAKGMNRKSFDVVKRLCYIGTHGMGGLEFYPIINEKNSLSDKLILNDLVDFANKVLNDRKNVVIKDDEDALQNIINVGTSAGGARAKAIVAYSEEKKEFRSGQIDAGDGFEYWLIKFDGIENNKDKENSDKSYFTRIEYAYYLMAKDCGINMTDTKLYIDNNHYHFMTKRFDRIIKDGKMQKLHMQTLGALMHYDFNMPRTVSYEEVASIIVKLEKSHENVEQFYRRMVFNVMARNQDDHVKNISFLMDRNGRWTLSPAYDVTYAYNPQGLWTGEHQMLVNGKSKDITYDDLITSAKSMGISILRAKKAIIETSNVLKNWSKYAKIAHLSDEVIDEIEKQFISFTN